MLISYSKSKACSRNSH